MKRLFLLLPLLFAACGSLDDEFAIGRKQQALSGSFDFETTTSGYSTSAPGTGASLSTVQVYSGAKALAVTYNGTGSLYVDSATSINLGATATPVTIHYWLPTSMSGHVSGFQCFSQKAASPWTWVSGGYVAGTSLVFGQWQTCTMTVPANTGALQSFAGLEIDFSSSISGTLYIDAVTYGTQGGDGGTDGGSGGGAGGGTGGGGATGGGSGGGGASDAGQDAGTDAGVDGGSDAGDAGGGGSGGGAAGGGSGGGSAAGGGTGGGSATGGGTGTGGGTQDAGYPAWINTFGNSSGCGLPATSGQSNQSVTVGTATRTFVVQVPQNYNPNRAYPLIFVFHGAYFGTPGTGSSSSIAMGLQNATGADAAIYVFPNGRPQPQEGTGSTEGWDMACNGTDMPFVQGMMNFVDANLCVNTQNRFATGYSWGGDMTDGLSCCMGSQFTAVAVGSGDELDYNPYDPTDNFGSGVTCAVTTRPAYRVTYDPAGDGAYTAANFQASLSFNKAAQSCAATSTSLGGNCVAWDNCAKAVVDCGIPGLGHNLPGTWAQDTWNFFSKFMPH